jgi:mutator protein MutT
MLHLALAVIVDDTGRILLMHRNTPSHKHWELPGGKINSAESEAQAIVREASEELGIVVKVSHSIATTGFYDRGGQHQCTLLLVDVHKGVPQIMEPELFDDLHYFSIDQLVSGQIPLSACTIQLRNEIESGSINLAMTAPVQHDIRAVG